MHKLRSKIDSSRRRWRGRRRGAAAVEFAVVAPILFLLTLATVEFGRAMLVQQVMTNASRAGAREASLPNATESSVITATTDYTETAGIDSTTVMVTISPDPASAGTGEAITVTASVNYDDVTWLPSAWFLGGVNLSASSVMRKEGFD